jgi:2'-5' RNA ligase
VPPPAALDHLGGALRRVRDRPGAPRWTGRELQHLTLAFYGDVPGSRVPALVRELGDVAGPEVHLRLAGAGTFPERGAPRVLWIGVDGDVESLAGLARAAADAGRAAGIDVDRRPYRPHLTVGRWPAAAPVDRKVAGALGPYAGPHFVAAEIVLMRSHHGAEHRYETVAAWRGAPGDAVGTHRPTPR